MLDRSAAPLAFIISRSSRRVSKVRLFEYVKYRQAACSRPLLSLGCRLSTAGIFNPPRTAAISTKRFFILIFSPSGVPFGEFISLFSPFQTPRSGVGHLLENLYSAINPAILLQSTKTNSVVGIIVVFADFLFLPIHH